ncbi:relaxosome protein TraM [Pectobacterium brasiliense]|uniref:relaxosome protein TraM n=1 Tax=Pectobacterium brasiliense TaxID=180957 RepID=UPI001969019C|nr:conjugal transfer protein [Pectobacterium brasiliense]MBN3262968.1 conjugal transfer protein [Pectobacterium brasiliense]
MPRKNVYFKDKLDREIEEMLEIERQNGASNSEANYSAMVNQLCHYGLMIYKSKEAGPNFDLEGFRRDLIRKSAGSREGVMLLTAMVTEMYLKTTGRDSADVLETVLDQNISAINAAESDAENQHFVKEE